MSQPPPNSPTNSAERLAYNVTEAAALLGVSPSSVRRLVQRGRLRRVPGFRHLLIPASELHKLVGYGLAHPPRPNPRNVQRTPGPSTHHREDARTNMNNRTPGPRADCPPHSDSTPLHSELILDTHHAQAGLDRFADTLRTLAREQVHSASGKSFPQWVLGEFDIPPALTEVLLQYRPEDESDQGALA